MLKWLKNLSPGANSESKQFMKQVHPDADDKNAMVGRREQALDLKAEIESGNLKTIEAVVAWAEESAAECDALLSLPVWIIDDRGCLAVHKTIAHGHAQKK